MVSNGAEFEVLADFHESGLVVVGNVDRSVVVSDQQEDIDQQSDPKCSTAQGLQRRRG